MNWKPNMNWKLRCAVDTCKALIPFHEQLRRWKQSLGYTPDLDNDRGAIEHGLLQIEWLSGQLPLDRAAVLEVGAGWEPLIPILFSLAGVRAIYTCDVNRLCTPSALKAAIRSIRSHRETIAGRLRLNNEEFDAALASPEGGVDQALGKMRIRYLAPCDCRKIPLPDASLNIVTSRAVLEHIPSDVIRAIYSEAFRLLVPGGFMCHIVDNSDHWQHHDRRISRLNFLKYPDSLFRWTCINGLGYQNRLRHSEHVSLMTGAGFAVVREERAVDRGALDDLRSLRVDRRFSHLEPEDLAALTSTLLVRRP
jgi:hypothetical protein